MKMLYCCQECDKWNDCARKWILAQKNLPQTCCVECKEFLKCLRINRIQRWRIIHGNNYVNPGGEEEK